jgi:hypothetical protein
MTEDQIRELLREMRDEPVQADSLRRVRIAVAERTQSRTRGWWRAAAVLAATACLVLLALWLRQPAPVRKPSSIAREHVAPPKEPAALPTPVPVRPKPESVVRTLAKRKPPIERTPAANGDLVIRIETPDPDVVILLIGD